MLGEVFLRSLELDEPVAVAFALDLKRFQVFSDGLESFILDIISWFSLNVVLDVGHCRK
jgi:hypothetical protein